MPDTESVLQLGMVAGEPSGDLLGAGVLAGFKRLGIKVHGVGVGGPAMLAQGFENLAHMDELAVNGFVDPLRRLPSLLGLLRRLKAQLLERQVDGFLGVDFNVFNLLLEGQLKRAGLPTAHYVSPSVYAWRRGRINRIARSADLLLALYPFEPPLYADSPIKVAYVGHPLADAIEPPDREARQVARAELAIAPEQQCIALLPGSRRSELDLMLPLFLEAAQRLQVALQPVTFVVPVPREALRAQVLATCAEYPQLAVIVDDQPARRALTAASGALVKSGTSTLEALLLRTPMVVSYRLGNLSYQLVRRLLRTRYIALPNILAGRALVPELLQNDATAASLAQALLVQLDNDAMRADYLEGAGALHSQLAQDANLSAARALHEMLAPAAGPTPLESFN
ncbi:MAG: lipid-A-disaccharide synthase [Pseudomonadales bacterium]